MDVSRGQAPDPLEEIIIGKRVRLVDVAVIELKEWVKHQTEKIVAILVVV